METVDKASSVRPTGISCTNMSRLISEFDFLVWLFLSTEFIVNTMILIQCLIGVFLHRAQVLFLHSISGYNGFVELNSKCSSNDVLEGRECHLPDLREYEVWSRVFTLVESFLTFSFHTLGPQSQLKKSLYLLIFPPVLPLLHHELHHSASPWPLPSVAPPPRSV